MTWQWSSSSKKHICSYMAYIKHIVKTIMLYVYAVFSYNYRLTYTFYVYIALCSCVFTNRWNWELIAAKELLSYCLDQLFLSDIATCRRQQPCPKKDQHVAVDIWSCYVMYDDLWWFSAKQLAKLLFNMICLFVNKRCQIMKWWKNMSHCLML